MRVVDFWVVLGEVVVVVLDVVLIVVVVVKVADVLVVGITA